MENTENHIDELIGKHLAGETTAKESAELHAWANKSEANQKYLDQFQLIFEGASAIKELHRFDEDAAWVKMKTKLKPAGKVVPLHPQTSSLKIYYQIAATIIVVMGFGFFVYKSMLPTPVKKVGIEVIAESKTYSETLPDGSGVFLNKKTKLSYAYDKKKKEHVVKLKGEAYFNIKHDENKKFIIDVAGVYIRDIGTSFNVKAYPESNTIEVVVLEGEVEFFTANQMGVHLYASGKGVYDKLTRKFSIEKPTPNTVSYKTKDFLFNNATLGSVVDDLNNVYDKKIILSNNLRQCLLTVTFNNEDVDEIASVISETLGLTIKKSSTEIVLEGPGCE